MENLNKQEGELLQQLNQIRLQKLQFEVSNVQKNNKEDKYIIKPKTLFKGLERYHDIQKTLEQVQEMMKSL